MVRHAGSVPYTTQYVGTIPVVYELEQLVLWGLGPLLGVAALAGVGAAAARARRGARAEWLLLAFAVPLFALTASFEVRFPRYLLPLYPLLAVWAAVWLDAWATRARVGRIARAAVIGATALYLAAFCRIYTREHTVLTASRWFAANVPERARVLSQHWDEGFPVGLAAWPDTRDVSQFPFYDPDTPDKVASLATELSEREWVVLQTRRLYGAVLRDPERYPYTGNFFLELFAGDLGLEVRYEGSSRPGLIGIELPDELADESFTVYDHPKVLIFGKREVLDSASLEARIRAGLPSRPLSRSDVLLTGLVRKPTGHVPVPEAGSSWAALLRLALAVELLGLAAYALLRLALPARAGLYALAKVAGPLGVLLVAWEAVSVGWLPFSGVTVVAAGGVMLVVGAATVRRGGALPAGRELWVTEVVFWGAFGLFVVFRALNPEIYWGEKPMDFAFLNTLYRASSLPPPEPWFANTTLSYTYFGHFFVAGLGRALGIAPAIMFNLGIGLAAGLLAAALLAAGAALGGRLRVGLAAVFLGLVCGNLAGPWAFASHHRLSFDYFWATSRVIPDTINEFPFWSFTFADLHAHVLATPWAVAFLAAVLLLVAQDRRGSRPWQERAALCALAAVTSAALAITNGWGIPSWGAALAVVLVGGWWAASRGLPAMPRLWAGVRGAALPTVLIAAGAAVLTLPFWSSFVPPEGYLGLATGLGTRPTQLALVFGLFLVLLAPAHVQAWWRTLPQGLARPKLWRLAAGSAFGAIALLAVIEPRAALAGQLHWATSVTALAAALALLALWRAVTAEQVSEAVAAGLAALALALIAGADAFVVWDRMNTVFKYHLDAWLLLAVAVAPTAAALLDAGGRWQRQLGRVVVGATACVAVLTAATGAFALMTHRHLSAPSGTLDGAAYLAEAEPEEAAAFTWVNTHVPGTPTVLEAFGASYGPFGRVSMHTGLPTVLGWEYHVYQRGQDWESIEQRKADVARAYSSTNKDAVAALLGYHGVALVWVGRLEMNTYGEACRDRFRAWPDLLTPLVDGPQVTVFGVRDRLPGVSLKSP